MASYVYDANGKLLDVQQYGPDAAFLGESPVPIISGTQLRQYAAIIYAEGGHMGLIRQINPANPLGEMFRECVAIAITMYNYTRAKGTAFHRAGKVYGLQDLVQDVSYVHGLTSAGYQDYFGTGGDEDRRQAATRAVMKLFLRDLNDIRDIIRDVNGALYWDGNDLFRRFPNHYRAKMGFELGAPQHGRLYQNVKDIPGLQLLPSCPAQDPNVAAKRQYTFLSTTTAGGSIFFKIHPQAEAQGISW
ncbi:MAG: hypothetical protein IPL65_10845 [Lewinellaceae bacterium]|nr:hypothetical protein [Lewinellaceae bacterium]